MLLTEIEILDELLGAYTVQLGGDFTAYRNHAYRVANLCVAFSSADFETLQKIAIAAAFHDMGIWTDGTFDYLAPSIRLANAYLGGSGKADWADVSMGLVTFGLPRTLMRDLYSLWPSAGFHRQLVELTFKRLRIHPWSPLPMMRL